VLHFGEIGGVPVALAAGRVHMYEGFSAGEVTFSVRVMFELGVRILLVTNASGGLNTDYKPGDIMVMTDHIFLPGFGGSNPLAGVDWDGRFLPMKGAYDARLRHALQQAVVREGTRAHHGVYTMVIGPTFETPAEARALRALGADAVGMSTVPEVIVARSLGMRVAGLSVITNMVQTEPYLDQGDGLSSGESGSHVAAESGQAGVGSAPVESEHAEVLRVSERVAPVLAKVVEAWVAEVGSGVRG
jgi:purine-nucleoside phosphorylase